ncbi:RNA-directed DNA polymerase, eukaryota, reverse transcriptase zinc-binding domain protein [Tanacetum coccineum]
MIKARRNKNIVESIRDEEGNSYEGNKVDDQFVKHFKKFLGESDLVVPIADTYFKRKVSNEEAQCMVNEVSDKEIKEEIFNIDSNKAAGHDGYNSEFFKTTWDIVGKDVCLAVKEFFKNGKLLGEVNATLIALIPKIPTPNKVSEFRPIACCNVIYKCIIKILTNIIKCGLSEVENEPKRCGMQVDIQKAYDTVSWKFLEDILINFGFPNKMVKWIMVCVSSSAFSIYLNGEVHGYFKGGNRTKMIYLFYVKEIKARGRNKRQELLDILPFKCGRLPVRYLGVPILDKRLGVKDYKVLIDKVESKIKCLRNKTLSYAGRIQLLASVLSSMQNY